MIYRISLTRSIRVMTNEEKEVPDYTQKEKLPYQIHFEKEIQAEYDEIAKTRDEEGKELPNKRVKKMQQGV